MLNMAAECLPGSLNLRWISAHKEGSAYDGNNHCDRMAKEAAEAGRHLVPENELPDRTMASVKREIHYYLQKEWAKRWKH